ncbi:MAG TPA: polysaccharide lyase, partial [Phnomibacter sp.]|nr:polysaccharide lyase [Phnomibacter sp.]
PIRDAVDARVVNEVATNKPAAMGSYGKAGIIDDPIAVGGWPIYRTAAAPLDSDMDGMPDEWEKLNGLNPFDATDRNKIHASGYTMLERYLNQLVLIKK